MHHLATAGRVSWMMGVGGDNLRWCSIVERMNISWTHRATCQQLFQHPLYLWIQSFQACPLGFLHLLKIAVGFLISLACASSVWVVEVCFIWITILFGWCRNLAFGGRATRDSRVCVPRKEFARSRHQRFFEENVEKTGKDMIYKH